MIPTKFSVLLILCIFLQGCTMDNSLINEMDLAYKYKQNNEDITPVVENYFPIGMQLSQALRSLEQRDFEIVEYSYYGFKPWPKATWERKYINEQQRKAAGINELGQLNYIAKKNYSRLNFIVNKKAVVSINSDGKSITKVKGFIYVDGI